jgi:hypothetical protein
MIQNNSLMIDLRSVLTDSFCTVSIYDTSRMFVSKGLLRFLSLFFIFVSCLIGIVFFLMIFRFRIRLFRYYNLYKNRKVFDLDNNPIYISYLKNGKIDKKDFVGNFIYLDRLDCINFDLEDYSKDKEFKLNKGVGLSTDYVSNKIYKELFTYNSSLNKEELSLKLESLTNAINKKIKREISLINSKFSSRLIIYIISLILFVIYFLGTIGFIDDTTFGFIFYHLFIIDTIIFVFSLLMIIIYENHNYKAIKDDKDFINKLKTINIDDNNKEKLLGFICCEDSLISKLEKNKDKDFRDKVKFYDYLIKFFEK